MTPDKIYFKQTWLLLRYIFYGHLTCNILQDSHLHQYGERPERNTLAILDAIQK